MANGGISTPNDPINVLQFSQAELKAIVEEVNNEHGAEHVFPDYAISKIGDMPAKAEHTIRTFHDAGVPRAFGTVEASFIAFRQRNLSCAASSCPRWT